MTPRGFQSLNRPLAAFLLGVFMFSLGGSGYAQTAGDSVVPDPLLPEEDAPRFPQWAKDLRREEIILFGSFPFTYFLASLAVDINRSSQHPGDPRYYPWIFRSAGGVEMNREERLFTIGIAVGGALLVSLADFVILQIKRNRAARAEAGLGSGDPIIIKKPWPPEEEVQETPEP
jgi:hypothetical protein